MLAIETVPAQNLTSAHVERWNAILNEQPELDSPYFRPEFTQLVASVRSDVNVAVIRDKEDIAGFFPHQRSRFGIGQPVGGRLSDFHGVIGDSTRMPPLDQIMKSCRLRTLQFDHLLAFQLPSGKTGATIEGSPIISMPNGFDAYLKTQKSHTKQIAQYLRKQNKIEREVGPLTLSMHTDSEEVFEQLIRWKVAQYHRTGAFNPLRFAWVDNLLRKIWAMKEGSFRGLLTALYVDKELLGVHFGMQSHRTLHYWFPAYNPDFAKYSPGNLMLIAIARQAAEMGISKVDLGKGTEEFKLALASAQTVVAEGRLRTSSFANPIERGCETAKRWLKKSPVQAPVVWTANMVRPLREWMSFG